MSYLTLLHANGGKLRKDFDDIAIKSMSDAYRRAKPSGKPPEEPDFIASLVKHGVPLIKTALDAVFASSGIQITTSGVFCHQSPMVKFTAPTPKARCELGDILFVHIHQGTSGSVQRNALLLQAKMTDPSAPRLTVPTSEQHQLFLYQHWPTFTYDMKNGGTLHGKSRTVTPHNRHAGAQYLLVDSDPVFSHSPTPFMQYPMAVWMAESPLFTIVSLGETLLEFLAMSNGRQFGTRTGARGWSHMIWDLIDNGLKKGFTRTRTAHDPKTSSRFEGDSIPAYACFCVGYGQAGHSILDEVLGASARKLLRSSGDGTVPPELLPPSETDDPSGGISLIVIETSESERRETYAE
ncbi:hypothetical protein [Burkholderia gladioli]|uniref:hypothetical protein n=1 Tax=Burkholderia gladioli TaxID=28095 RepID=UPI0011B23E5A|nr:hypothetical protein [Burkholderia gladioli]